MSKEITVITQIETTDIYRYDDDEDAEVVERMFDAVKTAHERNAVTPDKTGRVLGMKYFVRDVPERKKQDLGTGIGVIK